MREEGRRGGAAGGGRGLAGGMAAVGGGGSVWGRPAGRRRAGVRGGIGRIERGLRESVSVIVSE